MGAVLILVAGCASGGAAKSAKPTAPTLARPTSISPRAAVTTPKPKPKPVDPNIAVCGHVQNYVAGRVKATFNSWDTQSNFFDLRVGRELRTEATHLFSLGAQAHGAAAHAIQNEATGLVGISIGIEGENEADLTRAANRANSALAELRGTCNF